MKIETLFCPCNGRSDNPIDHYQTTDCGATEPGNPNRIPLEWIKGILEHAQGDTYHADGRLTATRILGCPLETLILDSTPVKGYDVRDGNATFWGQQFHKILERFATPGSYPEIKIDPFPFGQYEVQGRTDKVAADFTIIKDWKGHSESKQEWSYKDFVKGLPEHEESAQLNIYRIGIAKSVLKVDPDSYRPKLLTVHGAWTKKAGTPWYEREHPIMTEAQILALRPHDEVDAPFTQPHTVADIMKMLVEGRARIDAGEPIDKVITDLPMVGANIWAWKWNPKAKRKERQPLGLKCTDYCAAAATCLGAQRAAGRIPY